MDNANKTPALSEPTLNRVPDVTREPLTGGSKVGSFRYIMTYYLSRDARRRLGLGDPDEDLWVDKGL